MKKIALLLAAAVVLLVPGAASAQTLHASDYSSRSIDTYTATYDIQKDGSANVTIDFLFNFNNQPGHGPFVTYVTREPYDSKNDRFYRFSNIRVTSPSGAPTAVQTSSPGEGQLEIWIGDSSMGNVSGVQEYVLTYTLKGTLNATMASGLDPSVAPANDTQAYDEFYWNALGLQWQIPIDDITVNVKGDVAATKVACFVGGYGATGACARPPSRMALRRSSRATSTPTRA
jgi:hypothetical protein